MERIDTARFAEVVASSLRVKLILGKRFLTVEKPKSAFVHLYHQRVPAPAHRAVAHRQFRKIRVDLDAAVKDQMIAKTGRRTVPQIYIGEQHVGGYDDLAALDRAGGLDPLLKAA